MSMTSLLSVAQSALLAHERAVGIIGHNIANAETPGYTRQRARLSATMPQDAPPVGQVGRGVDLTGIERLRSGFFDENWRREAGTGSRYQTLAQTLGQASGILAEPGDAGIAAGLDALIDSFHTLASNPVDPAGRAITLANAQALADRLHSVDQRLESIAGNIGAELAQLVRDANGLVAEISSLNGQIRQAGGKAPDLLDRRDLAIDQLSQYLDVRAIERGQGTVDVLLGGVQLVTGGGGTQPLSVSGTGPYQVEVGNPPVAISVHSGRLAGLMDAFTAIGSRGSPTARATGLRGQLDDMVTGLVTAVNEIHSGYDPTTKPLQPTLTPAPAPLRAIVPLFDPAGVTASTVRLNSAVVADPTLLAAGYSTAAGDNSVALRLAQLRTLAVPVPGTSAANTSSPAVTAGPAAVLGEYYTGVVGGLGIATRDAENRAASQDVLVNHLEAQRQDASGVNIDEEMVRLIEHQQAYAAAARLVQVADEMLKELINLGR
jgi:flagellar hook-associated protein 1 FlgK